MSSSSGNSSFSIPSPLDIDVVRYLKPEHTSIIYNGYVYCIGKVNKDKTVRLRCSGCFGCYLKIEGNKIISHPTSNRHKGGKCQQMNENEIICRIEEEKLKHDALQPNFEFAVRIFKLYII